MNRRLVISLIILIGVNFFIESAVAWDADVTHNDLSVYAGEASVLGKNKGDYLRSIGFDNGLDEYIQWGSKRKEIKKWLQEGAIKEDAGTLLDPFSDPVRYKNHFHNPTKDWSAAGLSDMLSGESTLLWSQDAAKQSASEEGNWSWAKVRDFYRLALTSSTDAERQAYFAQTFRGLGHQMHMLQDMSQPDHVRNDGHPLDAILGKSPTFSNLYFETWAAKNADIINGYAASPAFPTIAFDKACDSRAPVPVCNLFDTRQYYTSKNPSVSLAQGLAEYTNANFFSDDTIFAAERYSEGDKHYFPYPKKSSTNLEDYENAQMLPTEKTAEDRIKDVGFYISKIGDGEVIGNFVRPAYLTLLAKDVDVLGNNIYARSFYRDEECHKNYAAFLIPRAVGYSAGLLNYFFRGQMDMTINPNNPMDYIIKNKSGEKMEGTFTLYYDDDTGNRRPVKDESGLNNVQWNLSIEPNSPSEPLLFPVPVEPAPKEKGKYILVFQGTLGNEVQSVVGKIVSAVCTAGEWKLASTRYGGGGGSACYTNLYYGVKNEQCTDEDQKHKYDISYSCVYLNGGLDGGGSCSSCTPVSLPKPTCAPQQFDACDYIPYKSVACSTALTGVMTYEWSCH